MTSHWPQPMRVVFTPPESPSVVQAQPSPPSATGLGSLAGSIAGAAVAVGLPTALDVGGFDPLEGEAVGEARNGLACCKPRAWPPWHSSARAMQRAIAREWVIIAAAHAQRLCSSWSRSNCCSAYVSLHQTAFMIGRAGRGGLRTGGIPPSCASLGMADESSRSAAGAAARMQAQSCTVRTSV